MNPGPSTGLVLGKFMPPHRGHVFLCDFARASCDRLNILVCSLPDDPIPGALRRDWMREMFPDCRVVWCEEVVPQAPDESPDFWPIWRDVIGRYVGDVDAVVASESYGSRLAVELGARFLPCDPDRHAVPVSATAIRNAAFANWRHIPEVVRPWFAKRVCVFGPESTGKTTLARDLATAFDTAWAPEYGRTYTEVFGTDVSAGDLIAIAQGQIAARRAAMRNANRILIEDTDAILTAVWSEMLSGVRSPDLDQDAPADLYLLTDIDLAWTDDGTRYFPDSERRERFFDLCQLELDRRGLRYAIVRGAGSERLACAVTAISEAFGLQPGR